MIPNEVRRGIYEYFAFQDFLDFQIKSSSRAGGGDINEAALLKTTEGIFFVKWNDANRFPKMFEKEALGLSLLRETGEITIPKPLHHDEIRGKGFLLMEAVITGTPPEHFWFRFGNKLAELHKHSNDNFGLNYQNYIGSLMQQNKQMSSWADFFVTQRLEPQLQLARDNNKADAGLSRKFNLLFSKLDNLFPKEPPALLHGDLWSGNYMVDNRGEAVLIDPAVYYGHREMDIAMTRLFGGFNDEFYSAYHSNNPLESGWEERVNLCNLYPLMVHVNLFGDSYLHQVEDVLKRF